MENYIIVSAFSKEELMKRVNARHKEGYWTQGGHVVYRDGDFIVFEQVMLLIEKP